MKNFKAYVNIKTELDLVTLKIQSLEVKEVQLNKEKELFYEVIVKGTNITRAIDKVSITYDVDVSTIWKNYYPKIKEDIKNLENLMKSSEILV